MIDLYYYRSPNARKVWIFLNEASIPHRIHWVDLSRGEQFEAALTRINPNQKIPAIVDHDGPGGEPLAVFESGAILVYLAEKYGRFLPTDARGRAEVLQWVFWQMANQGPMLGQAAHFTSHAAGRGIDAAYATERYQREAHRVYGVLNERLKGREWLCGDYSIADMACFPWCRVAKGQGVDVTAYPEVQRWVEAMAARPAVRAKPAEESQRTLRNTYDDDASWKTLFGGGGSAPSPERQRS